MEQTRIQMFEQQIYPEVFAEAAENIIERFGKRKREITEAWKLILQQYMERLADLQEEEEAPPIQEIDISFCTLLWKTAMPHFRSTVTVKEDVYRIVY